MPQQFNTPPAPLPPQGNYRAIIASASWQVSKRSGHPYVLLALKLSGLPNYHRAYIAADWAAQSFSRAANFPLENFNDDRPDLLSPLVGREIGVKVSHKIDDNNQPRANFNFLSPDKTLALPPFVNYSSNQAAEIKAPQNSFAPSTAQAQEFFQQGTNHNFDRNASTPATDSIPF